VSDLLEWRKHDTSTETTFTEFGQYMVERLAGDNFRIWLPDGAKNATIMAVGFASKDAARAACQSNLDGRRALETVEVLRQSEAAVATLYISSQAEIERLRTALTDLLAANDAVQMVLCDGPEVPGFDPMALGNAQRNVTAAENLARAALSGGKP
jgi:hypothetical protein